MNQPNLIQPNTVSPDNDDDSINLLDLVDIVLEQRWIIAIITAVSLVLGAAYAFMATPIYEANTLIQVEDVKGGALGALLGDSATAFDVRSPATAEIEILRSRMVVGQAAENLNLAISTDPALQIARFQPPLSLEGKAFTVSVTESGYRLTGPDGKALGNGRWGEVLKFTHANEAGELLALSASATPGKDFELKRVSSLSTAEALQRQLVIKEQGKQSGVIQVSLQHPDPVRAARILNEIGSLYVRQNINRKAAEAEKTLAFLNGQLPNMKKELESAEGRFNQFRGEKKVFDLGSEAQALLQQGTGLQVRRQELQQKRQELLARFTEEHPAVKAIDAQIKELSSQMAALESRTRQFPGIERELLRLTRDVKVNNELYTGLLNSLQQLRLVKEGKVGSVRVIDTAAIPETPVKPKRLVILLMGGLLGLMAGAGAGLLRHHLRAGIRSADEIEQKTGLSVYANVPLSPRQPALDQAIQARQGGTHLLTVADPADLSVESLRSLRTALQFAMLHAPNRVIMITGTTPGIGKSFISANLAAIMAATGKRVLLIEADMRKGHLHDVFGVKRSPGLSELVANIQPLEPVLRPQVVAGLDLIPGGAIPPNPAELLLSLSTGDWLQRLQDQYDLVLIDTPPVLAVSDACVLAQRTGTVLLVARAEITTLSELQETAKRLTQAGGSVRGVVFNGLDFKRRYGGGYGYRYQRYDYGTPPKGTKA